MSDPYSNIAIDLTKVKSEPPPKPYERMTEEEKNSRPTSSGTATKGVLKGDKKTGEKRGSVVKFGK
jgi:hypothetical protein